MEGHPRTVRTGHGFTQSCHRPPRSWQDGRWNLPERGPARSRARILSGSRCRPFGQSSAAGHRRCERCVQAVDPRCDDRAPSRWHRHERGIDQRAGSVDDGPRRPSLRLQESVGTGEIRRHQCRSRWLARRGAGRRAVTGIAGDASGLDPRRRRARRRELGTVIASGRIASIYRSPTLDLKVEGTARLDAVPRLVELPAAPAGEIKWNGTVTGPAGEPMVTLDAVGES